MVVKNINKINNRKKESKQRKTKKAEGNRRSTARKLAHRVNKGLREEVRINPSSRIQ